MGQLLDIRKHVIFSLTILLFIVTFNSCTDNKNPVFSIVTDKTLGAASLHGLTALTDALTAKKIPFEKIASVNKARGKTILVLGLSSGEGTAAQLLKNDNRTVPNVPEALTIWKTTFQKKPAWVISGFDDRGLMYGLLEVANRIGWNKDPGSPMSEVKVNTEKPDVPERAVSIYTMNRAYWESRFYDTAYWAQYLDMLAKDRFDMLVLVFGYENGGFLAPCYPYFFDVEGFPGVRMVGLTSQEQQRNLNALNRLIRMCHDRGIDFTVGIWDHIYRGGVQGGGIPGTKAKPDQPEPGLVWGVTADNLTAYTKAALAKFIKVVPKLDAIQFRMHGESGLKKDEEAGFWSSIFKMMKKNAPTLRLDLRAKELPNSIIQNALNTGVKFRIDTKYWMEQMGMPFHPTQINPEKSYRRHSYADLLIYPQRYKVHWRLWNGGTARVLLWGDPEYVRRFAKSTHLYNGDGYEVNEPLATKMEAQPQDEKPFELLKAPYRYYHWEFERYWHFFQVFGRIGYNPDTSPEVWQKEFERRFGKQAAPFVERALHQASWILPRIISSVYPYRLFPMTRGWAEKQRLGSLPRYAKNEGSDIMQFANFDEAAQLLITKGETAKMLPSTNSLWFKQTSENVNSLIDQAETVIGNNKNKEFTSTVADLKILSNLALYHSWRIPAAVSYCLFKRTNDVSVLDDAINYEKKAIAAWNQIVVVSDSFYTDNLKMGVCVAQLCGNWHDELDSLENGLTQLEQKRQNFKAEGTVIASPHYKPAPNVTYDELFQVTHHPITSLAVGTPLKLTIKVHAPAGIKWVHLRYRSVKQHLPYQTLKMLPAGEKDTYQATVPANQIDPKWDFMYFFEVMDNNGNGRIYPDLNKETPYVFVHLIR